MAWNPEKLHKDRKVICDTLVSLSGVVSSDWRVEERLQAASKIQALKEQTGRLEEERWVHAVRWRSGPYYVSGSSFLFPYYVHIASRSSQPALLQLCRYSHFMVEESET